MTGKIIDKQYFVIMWQEEFEMNTTPVEKLVYASVKSFTANGKQPCIESYLSISKRAGVSDVWTKKSVEDLIIKGWLIKDGEKTKRGGSCPVLKVRSKLGLNGTKFEVSKNLNPESSNSLSLSSKCLASKLQQSNKVSLAAAVKQLLSIKGDRAKLVNGTLFVNGKSIQNPIGYLEAIKKAQENIAPHLEEAPKGAKDMTNEELKNYFSGKDLGAGGYSAEYLYEAIDRGVIKI